MCVIYFGFGVGNYNIVAAANRDEYLDRPATRAHPWCEIGHPGILAGTDLGTVRVRDPLQPSRTAAQTATAGGDSTTPTPATATTEAESPLRIHGAGHGTWMGLNTATGTVAFLTNFREEPRLMDPRALSRGVLVRDALMLGGDTDADADAGGDGASPLERYVRRVHGEKHLYNGFNLVVGRIDSTSHLNDQQPLDAWYVGNRGPARPDPPRRLRRGVVYGLSNGVLVDGVSDWPKVEVGKGLVGDAIKEVWEKFPLFMFLISSFLCQRHDSDILYSPRFYFYSPQHRTN
ncbi:NRDE protein-domain-containing protein [Fimicolochytrium jonesii]|uniref:NRDE protein-domain-containing protein n=1 Tax=Fimicolochytrium jonesii TaxID=1396493 RepID=UPI0022FE1C2E|nr:NRDE protein-domain-containing protein [Fimicolochytrium jonesii]KAI8821059.1 NRDE protein-domain-containing protein [Fimicolochytrium jonesii]